MRGVVLRYKNLVFSLKINLTSQNDTSKRPVGTTSCRIRLWTEFIGVPWLSPKMWFTAHNCLNFFPLSKPYFALCCWTRITKKTAKLEVRQQLGNRMGMGGRFTLCHVSGRKGVFLSSTKIGRLKQANEIWTTRDERHGWIVDGGKNWLRLGMFWGRYRGFKVSSTCK